MDPIADLMEEIRSEPELAAPDPARRRATARLDQAELVEQVLFEVGLGHKYDGHAYRQLFDDLWLYAWPVIKAFIRTNRMGEVLRRYVPGRSVAISPEDHVVLHSLEEERDALALDVIARAVEHFHTYAVDKRGWSPTGGASLRTWFIGMCALDFPRAYQRWTADRSGRLDRVAARHHIDLATVADTIAAAVPDLATVAGHRGTLRAMIETAQPMTKVILGLLMAGLTQAQVAAELGLSIRAVEGRMYRFRKRVTRWYSYRQVVPSAPLASAADPWSAP